MYDYISEFYNNYDEESRLTSKYGSVEFLTTMRYVMKYIKEGDRILEIGAATGIYSHTLARRGFAVDAIELVQHNIDIFKKNTKENENITIVQGNALDLPIKKDDIYDITLLLGPLYHLYKKEDKQRAIREAIRVTKPGGIIFAAYVISDGCIIDEGFHRHTINVAEYIEQGLIDANTFRTKSEPKDLFELVRKEDIDELMSDIPSQRLHYVATNGCSLFMREAIDVMSNEEFVTYLNYHFTTCERPDFLGITNHALDIFRKESQ